MNSIKIYNNGFVISARSLPISDRVEQRATGCAIRKGWANKFWTRIWLPAKHIDSTHNCGKSFDNNDTNNNSNNNNRLDCAYLLKLYYVDFIRPNRTRYENWVVLSIRILRVSYVAGPVKSYCHQKVHIT